MELVRAVVIGVVVVLLGLRARAAWRHRSLAVSVWRAIRPRHVVGSLGLLVLVLAVALGLWTFVPATQIGLGSLFGFDGNVVFAPIDDALEAPIIAAEQAAATGVAGPGVPWLDVTAVTAFLLALTAMFPFLAHAEEMAFRLGWEDHGRGRQVLSALRFGLAHLIMFIPLGAALAVGVAGYVYGQIYRRAYAKAAVPKLVHPGGRLPLAVDEEGFSRLVMGPMLPVMAVDRTAGRRAGVFAATVWHTTFNTTVALVVLVGYLTAV